MKKYIGKWFGFEQEIANLKEIIHSRSAEWKEKDAKSQDRYLIACRNVESLTKQVDALKDELSEYEAQVKTDKQIYNEMLIRYHEEQTKSSQLQSALSSTTAELVNVKDSLAEKNEELDNLSKFVDKLDGQLKAKTDEYNNLKSSFLLQKKDLAKANKKVIAASKTTKRK